MESVELWPEDPSPDLSRTFTFPGDPPGHLMMRNVTRPTLTPHLPEPTAATGAAVVVCPGGAHHFLSVENEGSAVAGWLAAHGVAAFVLHYRVLPTPEDDATIAASMLALMADPDLMAERRRDHHEIAVADGTGALELVRDRASEWGVDPARVGITGFSAGAYVAVAAALEGRGAGRPDFVGALYGSVWDPFTPPADAPPLFAAWATDDPIGAEILRPCLDMVRSWTLGGHPVEAHAWAEGGHGFGMRRQGLPVDRWPEDFLAWLGRSGMLTA